MKKYFVIIIAVLVSAFAFAQLKDVPADHWAFKSVEQLVNVGVIQGYPDGTFRGTSAVTRYEVAVLLSRLMDKIELELGEVIKNRYLNSLKLINNNKDQIGSLYKVVKANSDAIDELTAKVEEAVNALSAIENLKITLEIHEGDITALYDIAGGLKRDLEGVNVKIAGLEKRLDTLDKDVISIYGKLANKVSKDEVQELVNASLANVNDQIEFLYKKINLTEENVKAYADDKVAELNAKVLNLESTVNDGMPILRDLVYQNSQNIKALEKKIMKYINVKVDGVNGKIASVEEMATFNSDTLNGLAMKLGEVEYALRKKIEEVEKSVDTLNANVETKADKAEVEELAGKVKTTNVISILALLLGAAGLGVAIYGIMQP
ncbi:MAG: S-layer homology domain-containing protein [Thermosipho sp. (in: Bacteria)]|nr:S-layer homology domain-containing protein [Thermosipho sp. (in: thermotogales)]